MIKPFAIFLRTYTFQRQLGIMIAFGIVMLALFSSVVGAWLGNERVRVNLIEQGRHVTENLARQSVLALIYASSDTAAEAATSTLEFPGVIGVEIRDAGKQVLWKSGHVDSAGYIFRSARDAATVQSGEGKRLLNVMRRNTVRMGQLIDDMLKFSRTGRVEIIFSEIDMGKMAREVFEELQPAAAGGKLKLEIENLPHAMGDRAMIRQVFVNLLTNAIKFSSKKDAPMIRVGAAVTDDGIIYHVKDNGAGFDMQFADKLFGVFQRLHTLEEFEGTGIGLAIVKRIISRHGGRVWAESRINEGATMYFTLPPSRPRHD